MTQEQKQFIIKALQTGIPAIAQEHIDAIEEVSKFVEATQEELTDVDGFQIMNQRRYENIVRTVRGSFPYMANDILLPFDADINVCQEKLMENAKAREENKQADNHTEKKRSSTKKSA